jgi:outer membrane protein assembly factor BamB
MNRRDFLAASLAVSGGLRPPLAKSAELKQPAFGKDDWPWWRGPARDGVAPAQKIPLQWTDVKNIVWEAPVPGRGHGSAIVVGERVFLATADEKEQVQGVLCLDRKSGKQLWHSEVHKGNFAKGGNGKSSHASGTPACDGERVFINFLNDGAVYATALDLDGKRLWQDKVTDYTLHQGYGASPAVYGPLVIVMADNKGEGTGLLAGLDRVTGKAVWTRKRPKAPNYSSPIILTIEKKDQLIQIGCDLVTSLDPLTGKENWEIKGATTECVTSPVTDGKHVFTSGGYPRNHVAAVKADGSGVAWDKKTRVYVPSMLVRDGHLFGVTDVGEAFCWKSDSGKEVWTASLKGTFSASPVMVGDHILATNESGRTFVFKADPKEFEQVEENQLGNEVFATPTVCGGRVYIRAAFKQGNSRQEKLVCVG